jgi:BMFP domain-containing protein YqiC
MNTKFIDEIARQISEGLPAGLAGMQQDVKKNIRTLVESTLSKLDLVTREEFDLQTEVLARTRRKLEALEKRLDEQKADKKPD